jgi:hypothetical protein
MKQFYRFDFLTGYLTPRAGVRQSAAQTKIEHGQIWVGGTIQPGAGPVFGHAN